MSGTPTFSDTPKKETSKKDIPKKSPVTSPSVPLETKLVMGEMKISLAIPHSSLTFGRRLGAGGFGEVFQGRWNFNDVAIKVLTNKNFTESALKEFKQEAEIMAKMRSDYIVQLRGLCDSPSYCLVMEYMPKGSLYDLLHTSQDIPWDIRLRIALDVTYGLAQLHDVRILHRDLKSLNILLDDRLRAKLADFGLSQMKLQTRSSSSAQQSTGVGTLRWMAPELISLRPKYSTQSDMYSYGVVLWELAAREIPFKEAPALVLKDELAAGRAKEEIPEEVERDYPGFAALIRACWETVSKRPSALEAAKVLEGIYAAAMGEPVSVVSPRAPSLVSPLGLGRVEKEVKAGSGLKGLGEKKAEISDVVFPDVVLKSSLLTAMEPVPGVSQPGLSPVSSLGLPSVEKEVKEDSELEALRKKKEALLKQHEMEELKEEVEKLERQAAEKQRSKEEAEQVRLAAERREAEEQARIKREQEASQRKVQEEQAKEAAALKLKEVEEKEAKRKVEQAGTKPTLLVYPGSPILASGGRLEAKEREALGEFLKYAVEGEQDKAEGLLKRLPGLLLKKGGVKDLSGREFKSISGFQYALWALDWHMWKMLLKYMDPKDAAEQFVELEQEGVEYKLKKKLLVKISSGFLGLGSKEVEEEKEEKVKEKHFSLEPLLEALNGYVKNFDGWYKAKAWDKMEVHWCREVGRAQLWLPAHVINEYCHATRSFVPSPEFKEEGLVRSMKLYGDQGQWFTAVYNGGKLGEKFGIVRYNNGAARASVENRWERISVKADAEAIQNLWKARQLQLAGLKSELLLSKTGAFKR